MNCLITIALVLVSNTFQINAQEGEGGYGDYGGKGGYGGYEGGYGGGYGGYGGYGEKKVIKPGVIIPPKIPYYKPIVTYSKYPSYGGKVIPVDKAHDYLPQFDLTKFIKPYQGAHLLQKYEKPIPIIKYAPPVKIVQPPIIKTIYQPVDVIQPVKVYEVPLIKKSKEIEVNKKPGHVEIKPEIPININDYGKSAVVKPKIPVVPVVPKEPVYEKPKVPGDEYGLGGGEGGYGGYGGEGSPAKLQAREP